MKTHKKALCEEERHRKQEEPPRKRRLALNYLAPRRRQVDSKILMCAAYQEVTVED
jgi:hypothetical protein